MLKFFKNRLFYLSILAFGLSAASTFLLSNLSSFFKFLGASDNSLPFLWLIPPITGLFIQPIVGQLSDNTSTKFGKRRPFILFFGLLTIVSLLLLIPAQSLIWAIFIILFIDFSINGCLSILRALTGDVVKSDLERSQAFALQAFFAGIGGAIGAILPLSMENFLLKYNLGKIIKPLEIPINLKYSLIVVAVIMAVSVFVVIFFVKERASRKTFWLQSHKPINIFVYTKNNFIELFYNLKKMPKFFLKIFLINSITWFGIFSFWLYFTLCLAQNKYGLGSDQYLMTSNEIQILYKANLDTSYYFSIYQYVSILYALLLYFISKSFKADRLHALSLIIGGIGMAFLTIAVKPLSLFLCFFAIGVMWGSLLILPYAFIMRTIPKKQLGIYLGVFNVSITAPQILCGFLLSPIYSYIFMAKASFLMLFAGIAILISAFFWFKISDPQPSRFITFYKNLISSMRA